MQFVGHLKYDYTCTCAAFTLRKEKCKHIRQVIESGERCAWNWQLDPQPETVTECPKCHEHISYVSVAV
jgi:hypothetical protein